MSEAYENHEGQEQYGFRDWVRRHKKAIIAGCCIVTVTVVGAVIYKKWSLVEDCIEKFKPLHNPESRINVKTLRIDNANLPSVVTIAEKPIINAETCLNGGEQFEVSKHIRNLFGKSKASAEKVCLALKNGFELEEHQTWVDNYFKNQVA